MADSWSLQEDLPAHVNKSVEVVRGCSGVKRRHLGLEVVDSNYGTHGEDFARRICRFWKGVSRFRDVKESSLGVLIKSNEHYRIVLVVMQIGTCQSPVRQFALVLHVENLPHLLSYLISRSFCSSTCSTAVPYCTVFFNTAALPVLRIQTVPLPHQSNRGYCFDC